MDLADTLGDADFCGVEFLFCVSLVVVVVTVGTVEMASTVLGCGVIELLAMESGKLE